MLIAVFDLSTGAGAPYLLRDGLRQQAQSALALPYIGIGSLQFRGPLEDALFELIARLANGGLSPLLWPN